jgi:RNA polymerase sigma-70 factor, ECF subfamily
VEAVATEMVSWPRRRVDRARADAPRDADDRRLAEALRHGDPAAIGLVEERYGRIVSGFLRQALADSGSAEEVGQQVLVEVWRRGPQYDPGRAAILTWIMTIARSRAIDELRRRRPEPVDPAAIGEAAGGGAEEVDRLIERWRLAELLGRIPAEEAEALRLRFYAELSQAEIAERTGAPLGTVKTRMVRGLARLREMMVEEGER